MVLHIHSNHVDLVSATWLNRFLEGKDCLSLADAMIFAVAKSACSSLVQGCLGEKDG